MEKQQEKLSAKLLEFGGKFLANLQREGMLAEDVKLTK